MKSSYSLELITAQTSVPNILLDRYTDMGLNENEAFFLILLLRLKQKKDILSPKIVARETTYSESQVYELIMPLVEKGFLTFTGTEIRLDNLVEKFFETWDWLEVKTEQNIKKGKKGLKEDNNFASLYQCFEEEMGRPLSPMEGEQITYWYRTLEIPADLIKEALRRSVLRGVFNFRYIETILLSWQQQNIRTVQDLQQYDKTREQQYASSKRSGNAVHKTENRSFRGEQSNYQTDDIFEV